MRLPGNALPRTGSGRQSCSQRGVQRVRHHVFDGDQTRTVPVELRHRTQQADGVRMFRQPQQAGDIGLLDDAAAVHHRDLVGEFRHHAEVVGDQQDRHAGLLAQLAQQVQDLRLNGDIEGSRRLVGDQEARVAGQRHGDHHPLAHAARQAVRIVVEPLLGGGDMHATQQREGLPPGLGCGDLPVADDRLGDLVADGEGGVERGHRLLEDHGDAVAAQIAHRPAIQPQQVAALEADLAAGDLRRRHRQQAHHRERRGALAAAAFADQTERAPGRQGEAHAVQRAGDTIGGVERHRQAVDLQQGGVAGFRCHRRCREPRCGRVQSRGAARERAISASIASR